jgi:hypothetical protein
MNIDAEINNYPAKLNSNEKHLLLDLIKKIDNSDKEVSIAEKIIIYNNELEEAVQQIKHGDFINDEDVLKEADEW